MATDLPSGSKPDQPATDAHNTGVQNAEAVNTDAENAALMLEIERTLPAMDIGDAEQLLLEAKQIFDDHGVVFFLRQGTCLGAYRDNALIPWDDDLDLGSIIDMHGFTDEQVDPVVEAFRANDCYVDVRREGLYTDVRIMKYQIRIDWQCYRVVKGTIAHYPGVPFPISLFEQFEEAQLLGTTFRIPSPPEQYLTYKYGPDWRTPKQVGYEKDVLDNMPSGTVPGRAGWFKQWLAVKFSPTRTGSLLVLNANDEPVSGAEVHIAGLSRTRTNGKGIAKFYIPTAANYAVAIDVNGIEEVLYEEALTPGGAWVYRPDPKTSAGRYFALTEQ
jgi:hypothetical protein